MVLSYCSVFLCPPNGVPGDDSTNINKFRILSVYADYEPSRK